MNIPRDINLRSNMDMGIRENFSAVVGKGTDLGELSLKAKIEDVYKSSTFDIKEMQSYDNDSKLYVEHDHFGRLIDKDPKKGNIFHSVKGYSREYYYNDTSSYINKSKLYQSNGSRTYEDDTVRTYSYNIQATTKKTLFGEVVGLESFKKEVTRPDGSQQIVECMKKGNVYHYTQKYIPAEPTA